MEMMHYKGKVFDPKSNILYGSTKQEVFIGFPYNPNKQYPVRVEMVGITYPDKEYFIERKHGDYFVLEYVVSGGGYIKTETGEYKVTADCVYLLPPGKAHRYGADKAHPYEKIWINFFSSIFTDILAAYGLSDRIVYPASNCKDLFEKLLDLARTNSNSDDAHLDVSGVLFEIILRLAKITAKEGASSVANLVKETLDACVYRKVSIENLSEQLNMSKSQMTREFTKYYGVAPYQYILDRKIEAAKHLLLTSSMRVYEISELLGFADTYYFSNIFKQKTGLSPLQFKRLK